MRMDAAPAWTARMRRSGRWWLRCAWYVLLVAAISYGLLWLPGYGSCRGRYHADRQTGAAVAEVTERWAATAAGLYRPAFTPLLSPAVWRIDENPLGDR